MGKVSKLRKVFPPIDGSGEKVAVSGMTFDVQNKRCIAILGHNGAGSENSEISLKFPKERVHY